jgi:DNA modification methylase
VGPTAVSDSLFPDVFPEHAPDHLVASALVALEREEERIQEGLESFAQVGIALDNVREQRLYRAAGYETWLEYLDRRWGLSRSYAHRLIEAARVIALLPIGNIVDVVLPTNEAQARPLARLKRDPEAVSEAWQEAVARAPRDPTTDAPVVRARDVEAAVTQVISRRATAPQAQARAHAERQARVVEAVAQRVPPDGLEALLDRVDLSDALTYLRQLPDACVDLCVTSPPYWAKRTYTAGPAGAHPRELGQEPDPQTYVEGVRRIVGQIGRVLRPEGWLFLSLGDTYASNPGGYRGDPARQRRISERARRVGATAPADRSYDVPKKSLCLVPWRLVTVLVQYEGWRCRNVIAWHKPNHLPENVHDRLTQAWEPVFALTKGEYPYFQRGSREGDLWAIGAGGDGVAQELEHPAPFPPKLVHRIIGHACPPGGVVLDPFAGSGTVLRVATSEGRRFLGCDLVGWTAPAAEAGAAG